MDCAILYHGPRSCIALENSDWGISAIFSVIDCRGHVNDSHLSLREGADVMKIELDVKDVSDKLILRNHIGEGSYDDRELAISTAIPDGSPVIEYDDHYFTVSIRDIAEAVCEAHLANVQK